MQKNIFGGRANVGIATETISFEAAGITALNTSIIYLIDTAIQSYVPGREINPIDGFVEGKGYYIIAITSMDQTANFLPPISTPLIVFTGESNAGGYALNSQALPAELEELPEVQILNNDTLLFEDLHIGVNNKLGHTGHEDSWYTTHGWELQLANNVEAGVSFPNPCYLVKTAQGGSAIADWDPAYDYWTWFQDRVDAAISLVRDATGREPTLYIFYSQGINDGIAGTNINTWKTLTLAHFDKIRVKYGFVPIVMTKFMNTYSAINTAIDQLVLLRPDLYAVNTSDATLRDANHWDYAGMKLVSDRMQAVFTQHYIPIQ